MEETRWWSRFLLVSAIVAIVLLVAAPFGYKFGISPLAPSLISLLLAMVAAALVLLVSLVMIVVAQRKGLARNRNLLAITLVLSLVPILVMAPQMLKGRSVPPIHDISTDTTNPPTFEKVVALRSKAINPLTYGAGVESPEKLAELTRKAYPGVKTLSSTMNVADAVARAEEILAGQGLEIVNADPANGIVEAVATTFWFGFKDDVVVRIRASDSGSEIDVRSVSRVGQSDVGANAARILKFLAAF